ncbi:AbiH family protein [Enterococcus faecalis]|uniref:AbiH family protein n=1 Tax=Enterococcus faecalis TaxID=1351 RepID=UPI00313DA9EF
MNDVDKCTQLIILGNGLDLSCNLKSSYNDFYIQRFSSEIVEYFKDTSQYIGTPPKDSKNYGFIELILLARLEGKDKEIYWRTIEDEIAELINERYAYHPKKIARKLYQTSVTKEIRVERVVKCLEERAKKRTLSTSDNYANLMEEFKKSISQLEKEFKKYLIQNVEQSYFYGANIRKMYNYLTEEKKDETYVLNFNYTNNDRKLFYEYVNVHGALSNDENIIFGIDESIVKDDYNLYDITKTYRKIQLDSKLNNQSKSFPKEIKKIKFYGHSLGEADYAYFQSIFDYFQIYDSNVQIIFYYYNYDPSRDLLSRQTNSIVKLLKDYSNSFSGNLEKKGKNLLHKLCLEGRLQIKELTIEYDEEKIVDIR